MLDIRDHGINGNLPQLIPNNFKSDSDNSYDHVMRPGVAPIYSNVKPSSNILNVTIRGTKAFVGTDGATSAMLLYEIRHSTGQYTLTNTLAAGGGGTCSDMSHDGGMVLVGRNTSPSLIAKIVASGAFLGSGSLNTGDVPSLVKFIYTSSAPYKAIVVSGNTIRLISITSNSNITELSSATVSNTIVDIDVSPTGDCIAVLASSAPYISTYTLTSDILTHRSSYNTETMLTKLKFIQGYTYRFWAAGASTVGVYNINATTYNITKYTPLVTVPGTVKAIAVALDGSTSYIATTSFLIGFDNPTIPDLSWRINHPMIDGVVSVSYDVTNADMYHIAWGNFSNQAQPGLLMCKLVKGVVIPVKGPPTLSTIQRFVYSRKNDRRGLFAFDVHRGTSSVGVPPLALVDINDDGTFDIISFFSEQSNIRPSSTIALSLNDDIAFIGDTSATLRIIKIHPNGSVTQMGTGFARRPNSFSLMEDGGGIIAASLSGSTNYLDHYRIEIDGTVTNATSTTIVTTTGASLLVECVRNSSTLRVIYVDIIGNRRVEERIVNATNIGSATGSYNTASGIISSALAVSDNGIMIAFTNNATQLVLLRRRADRTSSITMLSDTYNLTYPGGSPSVRALKFSSDGKYLYVIFTPPGADTGLIGYTFRVDGSYKLSFAGEIWRNSYASDISPPAEASFNNNATRLAYTSTAWPWFEELRTSNGDVIASGVRTKVSESKFTDTHATQVITTKDLYAISEFSGISYISMADGTITHPLTVGIRAAKTTADGKRIIIATTTGEVRSYLIGGNVTLTHQWTHIIAAGATLAIDTSPDSRFVAVLADNGTATTMTLLDIAGTTPVVYDSPQTLAAGFGVGSIAFSPTSDYIMAVGASVTVTPFQTPYQEFLVRLGGTITPMVASTIQYGKSAVYRPAVPIMHIMFSSLRTASPTTTIRHQGNGTYSLVTANSASGIEMKAGVYAGDGTLAAIIADNTPRVDLCMQGDFTFIQLDTKDLPALPIAVMFSKDCVHVIVVSASTVTYVSVFKVVEGELISVYQHAVASFTASSAALSSDDTKLYITSAASPYLKVVNMGDIHTNAAPNRITYNGEDYMLVEN